MYANLALNIIALKFEFTKFVATLCDVHTLGQALSAALNVVTLYITRHVLNQKGMESPS